MESQIISITAYYNSLQLSITEAQKNGCIFHLCIYQLNSVWYLLSFQSHPFLTGQNILEIMTGSQLGEKMERVKNMQKHQGYLIIVNNDEIFIF